MTKVDKAISVMFEESDMTSYINSFDRRQRTQAEILLAYIEWLEDEYLSHYTNERYRERVREIYEWTDR